MSEEKKNKYFKAPNNLQELPKINTQLSPKIEIDPHLERKCICFTCDCGACRCEYFHKVQLRLPVSTYKSQHRPKQNIDNLQFNNERWQYKPKFQLEDIQKQNHSMELRNLDNKSPPVKNDFDFHRIFAYNEKIISSYASDFSPHPTIKPSLIEPSNQINIMHNFQNYYLKTRKRQLEPISLIIEREPNLKEKYSKSPLKNREISYSVQSTYKQQYQKYRKDDSNTFRAEKTAQPSIVSDKNSLTLELNNPKLQLQSTFKHDFVQLEGKICRGRMERKIQRHSNLIDSKYYNC